MLSDRAENFFAGLLLVTLLVQLGVAVVAVASTHPSGPDLDVGITGALAVTFVGLGVVNYGIGQVVGVGEGVDDRGSADPQIMLALAGIALIASSGVILGVDYGTSVIVALVCMGAWLTWLLYRDSRGDRGD